MHETLLQMLQMCAAPVWGCDCQGEGLTYTGQVQPYRHVSWLSETFGDVWPAAFALLDKMAEFAASSGVGSMGLQCPQRIVLENVMRNLSTALCRGITRQLLATVSLRARLNGHPMVVELPVPTGTLIPVVGGLP